MTVFDAGANIGYFTCLAAARVGNGGQVHAFEPGEYELDALSRNVKLNAFTNVVINAIGLWETAGAMDFQEYGQGMGAYSSFGNTHHKAVAEMIPRTRRVQTTTIDQYVKANRVDRIDVLKMDIEGAELMAMRGAREVLSQNRCGTVICELCDATTEGCGYSARGIAAYLMECGFRLFELDANGKLRPHTLRPAYPYLELVAVSEVKQPAGDQRP
jgi:FkbM family methyltransferase